VETPFAGPGFEDAVEAVLRTTSLGRYAFDPDMPAPPGTVPAPVRGKFFYRFSQGNGQADLALKPGLVPEEFYRVSEDLYFKRVPPDAEEEALRLRRKIEAALLALEPAGIFDVRLHRPCTVFPDGVPFAPPPLEDGFRLRLRDYGDYRVGIEHLRSYHGNTSLCGLCLAWSLVRQWTRMEEKGKEEIVLPRRAVKVKSGALGEGIRDAFEFLFRGGDGRVTLDTAWGDETAAPKVMPGSGAFAFRLSLSGSEKPARTFLLKEAFVPKEYLRLCRIRNGNPGEFKEEKERKSLQLEFARRMLEEPEPFEVCDGLGLRGEK
jgi:hypothetical protein